jgi:hypothetical protein
MMRQIVVNSLLMAFVLWTAGAGPATRPTTNPANLERLATEAIEVGEYALALPLLKRLAETYKDDPERLGLIEEQIRLCERNLNSEPVLQVEQAPAGPRKPHVKPDANQVLELTIKDLGNFEYDPERGGNVPGDVTALNGATLRLNGYMMPVDQADRITEFVLVPSLLNCCFGQPAQVHHTVVVKAPKGRAVSYYPDEIVVEGILRVEEKQEEGYTIGLFELEARSVRPAPK